MKPLDRFIQRWRIARAGPYVPVGSRVLDIGCADGALFRHLRARIRDGVGIDPNLVQAEQHDQYRLIPGRFPDELPDLGTFDVITVLAVLEHVPPQDQHRFAAGCITLLRPGGYLIVTVPSPVVDQILDLLKTLRLLDGMSLEEHHGFRPSDTPTVFCNLTPVVAKTFQLGLNNLFVFQKSARHSPCSGGEAPKAKAP